MSKFNCWYCEDTRLVEEDGPGGFAMVDCPHCYPEPRTCQYCHGFGRVPSDNPNELVLWPCDNCRGQGETTRKRFVPSLDRDTWSLDVSIARFFLPRLKRFKQLNNGHPGNLTMEEWEEILDELIWTFDQIADEKKTYGFTSKEDEQREEEGLALFAKYFMGLWW